MLLLFPLIFTLQFLHASPQNVEIDSSLYYEGQKIGSPRIITNPGRTAKIVMNDQKRGQEYNFEILPLVGQTDPMVLQYTLAIRSQNKETFSRGRINLKENQEGEIRLDKGRIKVLLKVN